ncbi:AfsR/SARP family transcriptional regulator [Paractinoplanes durhamensis]|nr:hypothetical protein [Actinoplanes durhamensis]
MNRLATTTILLAVIAGPPLLAAVWLQHHPWQTPTRTQIQTWTEQPLTAATIIAGCVTAAGLGWLALVAYLAHRAAADLRRRVRHTRLLALPTPAQMTASSMAGVAALTLPAVTADHPVPAVAATSTPSPTSEGTTLTDADELSNAQPAGFALPGGGWIPYRTAAAVAALSAATWLYHRRHYRPGPELRDHRNDTDLQPQTSTVHTITTALTETRHTDDQPTSLLPEQLPGGILQLSGPGARAAARGILVTAALHTATGGDHLAVAVRTDDLKILLPGHSVADLASLRIRATDAPLPTPVASDSGAAAVTVIRLDEDPTAAHHWYVAADGTATSRDLTEPLRICCLDSQATTDLLNLAQHRLPANPQPGPDPGPAVASTRDQASTAGQLTLLGGCDLTAAGRPVHMRRTAGLQILAYLAVHPDGVTRTRLTQAIWPHLPASTISQRFHTTLADLRKQLRPLLGDDPIARHDDRYLLNTRVISADLQRWRTAEHTAIQALDPAARLDACRGLINLYGGELAAGWSWSWLIPVREQIRRSVIDAHTLLARHTTPGEALTLLQHAITVDPDNESLYRDAADLLLAAGDRAGAAYLMERFRHQPAEGPGARS